MKQTISKFSLLKIAAVCALGVFTVCTNLPKTVAASAEIAHSPNSTAKATIDNRRQTLNKTEKVFEFKNVSKYFDIKVSLPDAVCDEYSCRGKAVFSFFKKNHSVPYQIINLDETYLRMTDGKPNKDQAVIVADYNFDGMEDVALCNGTGGNYGAASYNVYLSSKTQRQFVPDKNLTELAQGGMIGVDEKRKELETYGRDGCCRHFIEKYKVVKNRPVRFYSERREGIDGEEIKITSSRLVNGKWKSSVRYEKPNQ